MIELLPDMTTGAWIRHAMSLFGWMMPGEVRVFPLGELAQAKSWLVG